MENITQEKEGKVKRIFREIFYFLSSKTFIENILYMLLSMLVLLLLVHFGMKWYTQHGRFLEVPNFKNITVAEATKLADSKNLKLIISDSIWTAEYPQGIVIAQSPEVQAAVKKNRSIYLTITKAQAEEKLLPTLAGNDNFNYYQRRLAQMKIDIAVRSKEFNNKLEDNTILYLYVGDKKISAEDLKKGVKVPQGSSVEAVITTRGTGIVNIPDLKCKTLTEAEFLLSASKLALGSVIKDGTVTEGSDMYVWRQSPPFIEGNTLNVGSAIDVYVTRTSANCQ